MISSLSRDVNNVLILLVFTISTANKNINLLCIIAIYIVYVTCHEYEIVFLENREAHTFYLPIV